MSDGGSEENNAELLNMIRSTTGLKYSQIVITGNFNLPHIDWKHWTNKSNNPSNFNLKFVECLTDIHVSSCLKSRQRTRHNQYKPFRSNPIK